MPKPRFPQDPIAWRAAAEAELADLSEVGGPWATAVAAVFVAALMGLALWSGTVPPSALEADGPALHATLAASE